MDLNQVPSFKFIKKIDDFKKEFENEYKNLKINPQIIDQNNNQIFIPDKLNEFIKDKNNRDSIKLFTVRFEAIINFYKDNIVGKVFNINVIEEKLNDILKRIINHFREFNFKKQTIRNETKNLPEEDSKKIESFFNKYEKIYEKSNDELIEQIKNLVSLLKEIVNYINSLQSKILEQKSQFESLIKEQENSQVENIKFINAKYYSSYLKFLFFFEKYNGYLDKLKAMISKSISLKKLRTIQDKINNIIDSKKLNIQKINFNDSINDINLLDILNKDKSIDNLYIPSVTINQMKFNILFIFDITSSMGEYLDSFRNNYDKIINEIKNNCPLMLLYLGFIGYKDIQDLELGDEYIDINFTLFYDEILQKIKNVQAEGGDDIPEDVSGAFEMALNKSWNKGTNIIFLVTDAPCHGLKYHDLNQKVEIYKDKFPNGFYTGNDEEFKRKNIEKLVEEFVKKDIHLICLDIHENTQKMFKMFKEKYDSENKSKLFNISKEDLVKCIINKVSEIYSQEEQEILKNLKVKSN